MRVVHMNSSASIIWSLNIGRPRALNRRHEREPSGRGQMSNDLTGSSSEGRVLTSGHGRDAPDVDAAVALTTPHTIIRALPHAHPSPER